MKPKQRRYVSEPAEPTSSPHLNGGACCWIPPVIRFACPRRSQSSSDRVDAHLAEWQEILETAMRFATNCATACARASAPTRRRFNQAVFARIDVRDGKLTDMGYHRRST
jgi:hypothetical protein